MTKYLHMVKEDQSTYKQNIFIQSVQRMWLFLQFFRGIECSSNVRMMQAFERNIDLLCEMNTKR